MAVESTVVFNTDCARCQEGKCSGRLSFHLPPEAADQHNRRHGGNLPAKQVRELYELLRYTKEDCAFYPPPFALALDGAWGMRFRTEAAGMLFLRVKIPVHADLTRVEIARESPP